MQHAYFCADGQRPAGPTGHRPSALGEFESIPPQVVSFRKAAVFWYFLPNVRSLSIEAAWTCGWAGSAQQRHHQDGAHRYQHQRRHPRGRRGHRLARARLRVRRRRGAVARRRRDRDRLRPPVRRTPVHTGQRRDDRDPARTRHRRRAGGRPARRRALTAATALGGALLLGAVALLYLAPLRCW